ncbi:MAG: EAL domain-containing protein [Clostridia bacterium]|nr:EAL domain-containing protein [Clostridia bacterium]
MKTDRPGKRKIKRVISFLFCFIMVYSFALPVSANAGKDAKTVRVGWFESAFHRTDQFGRRSGYGYEYQQRIATFTGWNYEYVEGSWSELLEKLIAGEIDLLSDVSYTEARAEKILYSALEMGSEDYHVFIAPTNTEIRPDDFSTLNGKRVGVNKNSIQEQLFIQWAAQYGVTPDIVELTEKTPELLAMLGRGEIDALVTLDTYGNTADVLPVCKVGAASSFFGINKNRPDIKQELDVAMNRIMEDNRNFNEQMTARYNKGSGLTGFLTADELAWFSSHGVIRVGYKTDYLPFCGFNEETKALEGALSDILAFARTCEKNAELSFETYGFQSTDEGMRALAEGKIDCLFPANLSSYDGEQLGAIITDAFATTELYAAVRTADRQGVSQERDMTVAITQGNLNYESFLMDYFPNWKVAYYDSSEESFKAVSAGKADCVLVSNYRLNRVTKLCDQYKLSTLATGKDMDLSFAVRKEDDCLYSILNKISRLIPDSLINSSLTAHSFLEERVTFEDFLRDNLAAVLASMTAVALLIITLLLHGIQAERRANKERQLISAVETDTLTGLYNRNFFFEYANRMHRETPEPIMDAVVLNIEQFHTVNELHGKDFGDQVLKALGEAIRDFLSKTDGIGGRFEGDRFDIFCVPQDNYHDLLRRFQARFRELFPNASIRLRMGVAPWQKDVEPMQLFDRARTASSIIRGSEKHLMVYDQEMHVREDLNHRLLNDFERALRNHEFEIYYQHKYDIQSEPPRFNSAEALIRWHHPELGVIPPGDFIPLFESNGQISEIDKYVWRGTAQQIAKWREKYGVMFPVSVNLSRVDALDPALEQTLDGLLKEFDLDTQYLHLEVTESAYTEDADQLRRVIQRLRAKGYKIEMDDFGSGYSSLNMLSSIPIDVLKMDMGFIQNIEHDEKDIRLVELIIDIANNLKVPVVAEGVETETQMLLLKKMGCALVQGYYFSKPLPAAEFEASILKEVLAGK